MSTNDVLNGTPWFRKVPRTLSCRIRSARRRSSSHSENKRREYQRSEESNKHNERVVPSKKEKIKLLGSRRHNWNSLPLELKEWEWRKEEQNERKKETYYVVQKIHSEWWQWGSVIMSLYVSLGDNEALQLRSINMALHSICRKRTKIQ